MKNPGEFDASAFRRSVEKRLYHLPVQDGVQVSCGRAAGSFARGSLRLTNAGASVSGVSRECGADAVALAVARLAAAGAQPLYVLAQVTVGFELEEPKIHCVFDGISEACRIWKLPVPNCEAFSMDIPGKFAVVNVMAVGETGSLYAPQPAQPGDEIVMAGYAGWQGSRRLTALHGDELRARFSKNFLEPLFAGDTPSGMAKGLSTASAREAAQSAAKAGGEEMRLNMHAAGEGGVYAALWNIGERNGLGIRAFLERIPIRQETIEICDYLGIDPYQLMSGGVMLVASNHSRAVLGEFAAAGIPAAVVGYFTGDNDRVMVNHDESRFLEPFRGDSFYTG